LVIGTVTPDLPPPPVKTVGGATALLGGAAEELAELDGMVTPGRELDAVGRAPPLPAADTTGAEQPDRATIKMAAAPTADRLMLPLSSKEPKAIARGACPTNLWATLRQLCVNCQVVAAHHAHAARDDDDPQPWQHVRLAGRPGRGAVSLLRDRHVRRRRSASPEIRT
jgi:hypothetical protein